MLTTRAKNSYLVLFGAVLILIDQTVKSLVYSGRFGGFLLALRPVFSLEIFPNVNFAFSLKVPQFWAFLIYFILLCGLVGFFARTKNRSLKFELGFTLIIAGALSNIFDRVYLGFVRDFIYVFWGNIFNLADVFIVAGILLMIFN